MRPALLIVDYQNAVFTDPPAREAKAVFDRIITLVGRARAAGVPVVLTQHEEPDGDWRRGSAGWQYRDELLERADAVVQKSSCDAFRGEELTSVLAKMRIDALYICGYATEFCVDTTMRRAASAGFMTYAVSDAHTTRDRDHLDAAAIVAHHAFVWSGFVNAGNPISMIRSDDVSFTKLSPC